MKFFTAACLLSSIILITPLLGSSAHADTWQRTDVSWGSDTISTQRIDTNYNPLSAAGNTAEKDPNDPYPTSGLLRVKAHAQWGGDETELYSGAGGGADYTYTFSPVASVRDNLQYIVTAVGTGSFGSIREDCWAQVSGPGVERSTEGHVPSDSFSVTNNGITVTAPGSSTNSTPVIFGGTLRASGNLWGNSYPEYMAGSADAELYIIVDVATPAA